MLKEFKDFLNKGSMFDLAVGLVLGLAFSAVITTLVDRIISPLIGLVFGVPDLEGVGVFADGAGSVGAFLQALLNFVIVAFVIFLLVKAYNRFKTPPVPAADPEDVALLREIRDELRTGRQV